MDAGLAAILGAVAGAAIAFVGDWFKWRRESARRFDTARRDLYARFVATVSRVADTRSLSDYREACIIGFEIMIVSSRKVAQEANLVATYLAVRLDSDRADKQEIDPKALADLLTRFLMVVRTELGIDRRLWADVPAPEIGLAED